MGIELHSVGSAPGLRLTQRIRQIPWGLVILITMVASMGFVDAVFRRRRQPGAVDGPADGALSPSASASC